jgi:putative ABC transport system substrate-binding protein
VGFLNSASPDTYRFNADSFREGLTKGGFVEGRNLRIEERWARSDYDALPALAAELVAMGVVAIAATGDVASARAAQRASNTVPVVFTIGGDPVRFGLVKSLNRPGGHVTGILFNQNVLGAKRVELLREIAPNVSRVALLMNPTNPNVDVERMDAEAGARKLGWKPSHSMRETRAKSTLHSSSCCVPRPTESSPQPIRLRWIGASRLSRSPTETSSRSWVSYASSRRWVGF